MCLEFSVVFLRIVSVSTENLGCPFLERLCYCVSTNAPDQKTAKATGSKGVLINNLMMNSSSY